MRQLTFREHWLLTAILPLFINFGVYFQIRMNLGRELLPSVLLALCAQLAATLILSSIVESNLRRVARSRK